MAVSTFLLLIVRPYPDTKPQEVTCAPFALPPPARCGFNMGMIWDNLTPEELCDLMCGEPQEDEEDNVCPEEVCDGQDH